ncbi:MAG TPA: signal peptidase I [Candidatus Saccharimonadales bacterium]|nr:signal peptidase I [Candidatus Saccharimonadales bacterium]
MSRISKFVYIAAVIFVVCCGAVLTINCSALGYRSLAVASGSMKPAIPIGSMVLVHRVPDNSLKVGDVITYTSLKDNKKTITHRIIKSYKLDGKVPAYVTKGDSNQYPDTPIVAGMVKGKVVWHIPYLGHVMIWSKTWTGIAILVYLPALLIMLEEVKRLSDYLKLSQPYHLAGFRKAESQPNRLNRRVGYAGGLTAAVILISGFAAPTALALFKSNTVSLVNNRLTVAASSNQCNGHTTVNVDNTSTQTSTTGSASSSGNTNGGTATSGGASNTNNTSVNISVNNC